MEPKTDPWGDNDDKKKIRIPSLVVYGSFILCFAILIPTAIYVTVFTDNPVFQTPVWTCALRASNRVPCSKGFEQMDSSFCTSVGCCWNDTDKVCYHSIPSLHSYSVSSWVDNSSAQDQLCTNYLELTPREKLSPYRREVVDKLRAAVVPVSKSHLRILVYDYSTSEPTLPPRMELNETDFQIRLNGPDYFSMEISRREDESSILFSTSRGPLIASMNYWELTLQFPTDNKVFGLGQLELTSTPKLLYNNENGTGANPFIMVLNPKGNAHGVLFDNSGPMEFELLAESNLLIVRSLSTLNWDFSIFAGPTPKDVMEQFTNNRRPILPPQWALGLHICRDTEYNTTYDPVHIFSEGSSSLNLPYESDCLQENLLSGFNFTIPDSVNYAIDEIRNTGKRLLLSLQPQVEFSLVTDSNKDLFVLYEMVDDVKENAYKNVTVAFPDVFNNDTPIWLQDQLLNTYSEIGDIFGGYVLQEDWPAANSSRENLTDMMDYVPEDSLTQATLWPKARHNQTFHYIIHNQYGLKFAQSLNVPDDSIVLSTSTFTGSGALGGSHAHELSQVNCTWDNMAKALNVALGLGLSGIPLAGGGPVCGNVGDYDDELCLRWYLMSSMLPLMRVSSELPLRDPVNIRSFNAIIVSAVRQRYSLISYFYSLFKEASVTGVPVARPMFFEFPSDNDTWNRYDHFMVGPALLVRPMFLPNQVTVRVYLPKEDVPWYHLQGGHKINNGTGGYEATVPSLPRDLVVLVRGGYIVPLQEQVGLTVDDTVYVSPYTLVVGLNCSEDGSCIAIGNLKINQDTLNFTSNESGLVVETPPCTQQNDWVLLDSLTVYGLNVTAEKNVVVTVTPGTSSSAIKAEIESQDYVLRVQNLSLLLCDVLYNINWTFT